MPPPSSLDATNEDALLALLARRPRLLLTGPPGSGKSTLAHRVAARLAAQGQACRCLAADPRLPGIGPPGAICLGRWDEHRGDWQLEAMEALATLDSARFRLPLVEAVRRLAERVDAGALMIDAPGVERGIGGAELLAALASAGAVSAVVRLAPASQPAPYPDERASLGLETLNLLAHPQARHPGKQQRRRWRNAAWDAYLEDASEANLDLSRLAVIGTPPPQQAVNAWRGRQVGLLNAEGHTLALGEILALEGERLRLRLPAPADPADPPHTLVVRDAVRHPESGLGTARPQQPPPHRRRRPCSPCRRGSTPATRAPRCA